ncbi:MAG: DNA-formamidopyrimidine glycosylase [Pyrinomonadaceae bacterium]
MPEGPEVQTIVTALKRCLHKHQISDIHFVSNADRKMLDGSDLDAFRKAVIGQKVVDVKRRGKFIVIQLSSEVNLVIHLLMTGQLLLGDPSMHDSPPRFLRCIFEFTDGQILCIADKSTWVKIQVLRESELNSYAEFLQLGVDVLEESFTPSAFQGLMNRSRIVHSLLLDQTVVSGLGNIYVNECLFLAGIHPGRRANSFSEGEVLALYFSISHVMREALSHGGTTFSDYRAPSGERGRYQDYLKVFKRKGQECYRCGTTIERIAISGRGAFFCPKDQIILGDEKVKALSQGIKSEQGSLYIADAMSSITRANFVFVLIGSSSVGKTTLSRVLKDKVPFLQLVPTFKTRPRRPGEDAGIDSIFLSTDEFSRLKASGEIALSAFIHGHHYGTPINRLRSTLESGQDACIILSPEGAQDLKALMPNTIVIGVEPPDTDIIKQRTLERLDYTDTERRERLGAVIEETHEKGITDFTITSVSPQAVFLDAVNIIYSVRCSTSRLRSDVFEGR